LSSVCLGTLDDMQRLHYSSARHYRSLRDEFAELPTSLAQARSFQGLGDHPLVVVTAARDATSGLVAVAGRDGDIVHQ
jgi:hypothetical protein